MVDNNEDKILLLQLKEIVNGTTNIFGEMYNVVNSSESSNTLSLNNIVEFLGLENCSAESVIESLQQWIVSQMLTTTELPKTTGFSLAPAYVDEDNNWLTQEIDTLDPMLPV